MADAARAAALGRGGKRARAADGGGEARARAFRLAPVEEDALADLPEELEMVCEARRLWEELEVDLAFEQLEPQPQRAEDCERETTWTEEEEGAASSSSLTTIQCGQQGFGKQQQAASADQTRRSYFRTHYSTTRCVLTWLPQPPNTRKEVGVPAWKLRNYQEIIAARFGEDAPNLGDTKKYAFDKNENWTPSFLFDLLSYAVNAQLLDARYAVSFQEMQSWFDIIGQGSRKYVKFQEERVNRELLSELRALDQLVPRQAS